MMILSKSGISMTQERFAALHHWSLFDDTLPSSYFLVRDFLLI